MKNNLKEIRPTKSTIMLDRPRTLNYDLNALAELEDHYGSVQKSFDALKQGSIKPLRFLLWVGLVHEDETLTERQAGALVGMANVSEVTDAIGKALGNATPDPDDAPEPDEGKPLDPT